MLPQASIVSLRTRCELYLKVAEANGSDINILTIIKINAVKKTAATINPSSNAGNPISKPSISMIHVYTTCFFRPPVKTPPNPQKPPRRAQKWPPDPLSNFWGGGGGRAIFRVPFRHRFIGRYLIIPSVGSKRTAPGGGFWGGFLGPFLTPPEAQNWCLTRVGGLGGEL